ncbi:MAG: AI-2E family transporter [Lachnospiraceae bacterium]|nr:AI-2E family transporter [Lachnospiraceae bacterium]
MDKKGIEGMREYLILIIVIIGVCLGFKYLSPLVTPFLLAFAFVALLHPLLESYQKKYHIKKGFLTAGILLVLCVTVGIGVWGLLVFLFRKFMDMSGHLDIFEEKLCIFVRNCCEGMEGSFGMDAEGIEHLIMERVNVFIESLRVEVVPRLMNESVAYARDIAEVVGFLAIMIVAAVLLAKDYSLIMEKLQAREELCCALQVGRKLFEHVGIFIKAQLIILLTISLLSAVTLFAAGIKGGIGIGLFTGFMDMLPFIGTGLVLVPLAFWQMLNGYYGRAFLCVLLYVACTVIREFLEPKLVGKKMGLFPIVILFSVYAGMKLFGVSGIIKGPLALVTICEIYRHVRFRSNREENLWRQSYGSDTGTQE